MPCNNPILFQSTSLTDIDLKCPFFATHILKVALLKLYRKEATFCYLSARNFRGRLFAEMIFEQPPPPSPRMCYSKLAISSCDGLV